jgi:hypothetical protein
MVNQLSSERPWPHADLGSAVELLRNASAGEVFIGHARFDGALSQGWRGETSRSLAHQLSAKLGRWLAKLLSGLRTARQPWWELSNYLLTDIGKTRADAESEKLLHWQTVHYPCEPLDQDIRPLSDSYRRCAPRPTLK